MTQAHIDNLKFYLESEDIVDIYCHLGKNKVICNLDYAVSIIVKCINHKTFIVLQNGSKNIKLSQETFDRICDSKISVRFLKAYLQGNIASWEK